jgi:SAM-dependent methyltransferase
MPANDTAFDRGKLLTIATSATAAPDSRRQRALFLATICTGSFLLFLVQPMIARMALPRLGGAPAVWNSAMLVYQALLLAGYAYAHWLGRLPARRQAIVHIALFCIAAVTLPIALYDGHIDSGRNPVIWVPWLLLTSIGPLFFVIASQAPLIQRWFSISGGENPYPLYAASNLGSFAGLLTYPLVVEPMLDTRAQSLLWSGGYALVALLTLLCALRLPRIAAAVAQAPTTPAPGWRLTLRWIALAAIASGLMLSTSLHLTTDVAAMPLMWVIPLGLYLLSFTVAFSEHRELAELFGKIAPYSLLAAALTTFIGSGASPHGAAVLVVGNLFIIACVLHARMFDSRPAPEHLTRFYLAMSVGGAIGGLFCALLAPLIFDWTYEHPILLIAAALAIVHRPAFRAAAAFWQRHHRSYALTALILAVLFGAASIGQIPSFTLSYSGTILIGIGIASVGALCGGHRLLFVGALIATMLSMGGWRVFKQTMTEGQMTRSYFGINSVEPVEDIAVALVHGTTIHGVQLRDPAYRLTPPTYYTRSSGIGLTMAAVPTLFGENARIGVLGLGAGALTCYAKPGQDWRFYEIDPAVVAIARDPRHFTFISSCRPDIPIIIGDARLTVAQQPAASADVLVVDVFSSDAVPIHLLTREAFAVYRRHLAPNGLLVFHISNRFLDLKPVIAAAAEEGWTARLRRSYEAESDEEALYFAPSDWVAMSPDPKTIAALERATRPEYWSLLQKTPGFRPWTDQYGSILPLLIRRFTDNEIEDYPE